MSIRFNCTDCGKELQTPDELAGKRARCKACGTVQTVPEYEEPAPEREEDEPRRRKRKRRSREGRAKSSATKAVIIFGSLAALFVCLILMIGGATYYFLSPRGSLSDEVRYLPDNYAQIRVYQFDSIRSSAAFGELQKCPNFRTHFSFAHTPKGRLLDLSKATVAETIIAEKGIEEVAILTMKNKVAIQDLVDPGTTPAESKVSGRTVYEVDGKSYFIDGKRVVVGSPTLMRAILSRNGDAKTSDNMKAALKEADFSRHDLMIMDPGGLFGEMFKGLPGQLTGDMPIALIADTDYSMPMKRRLVMIYPNPAAAAAAAQRTDMMPAVPERKPADMKVRVEGSRVINEYTVPANQLCDDFGG
jgi:hypothetical protein